MFVTKPGSHHTWDETHRYWYCERAGYDVLLTEAEVALRWCEDRFPCGCEVYPHVVAPEPELVLPTRREA